MESGELGVIRDRTGFPANGRHNGIPKFSIKVEGLRGVFSGAQVLRKLRQIGDLSRLACWFCGIAAPVLDGV